MQTININWRAVSFQQPKDFEFKELRPFNPWRVKKLKLYNKPKWKNIWYLPRIYILPKQNKDKIVIPKFLRPKQKIAVANLLENNYWILLSWVGSGKSYMIGAIAQEYNGNTLVVVPKKEIAKWLKEKFDSLWIENCLFDSKKFDIRNPPKVLIMVQKSVNLYWEKLSLDKVYKQVLIDEIHMEFTKNRIDFFVNYQYEKIYWFTWTPELNNYSSLALYKIFNNVSVNSWIWPKDPDIYTYLYTDSKYNAEDWQELVTQMYWDKQRLCTFVQLVSYVMKQNRNMWIIFVDRKDIAEWLAFALNKVWVKAVAYTGSLSSKKRQETLEYLTEVKWVMVATYQTVWTWFDHPPLDTAFYFMFVKFKAQVKQALWRILRWADKPVYVDFQDINLYNQRKEREKAYMEMWSWKEIHKLILNDRQKYIICNHNFDEILKFKKEEDLSFLKV